MQKIATAVKLFLCVIFYLEIVLAQRNWCCRNNETLLENEKCSTGFKSWASTHCNGSYNTSLNNVILEDDFWLKISDLEYYHYYAPYMYCLGFNQQDKNEMIAIICNLPTQEISTASIIDERFICCSISAIFLITILLVYWKLPYLRDLHGKSIMFFIFNLLMTIIFVEMRTVRSNYTGCMILASMIYFWFLSVIFWLNVMTFDIWRTVVRPKQLKYKTNIFLWYNLYGWGGPSTFLIITLICHHIPGDHMKRQLSHAECWFLGFYSEWKFFYGPIAFLLLISIILMTSTFCFLWKQSKHTSQNSQNNYRIQKYKFLLTLKIFLVLFICWSFAPIMDLFGLEIKGVRYYIWIILDMISNLQGIIFFIFLVILRQKVRHDLSRKLCCNCLPFSYLATTQNDYEEFHEEIEEHLQSNV